MTSLRFGEDFELDLRAYELRRAGHPVKLERIPMEILLLLLEHHSDLVSREQIAARIWGDGVFVDTDNNINGAIRKIRQVLRDDPENPRFILTVTGKGYRFVAPLLRDEPSSPAIATPTPTTTAPAAVTVVGTDKRSPKAILAGLAAALVLCLLAWAAWRALSRPRAGGGGATSITSLAVLPLENLSGDAGEEYFADGMTDALITELAKIRALRVTSRTSTMAYKGTRKPLRQVAQELGVDALVEGTVVHDGERVRITAQLVRGRTDEHLWADDYERDVRDVLSLQREVALAIASEVRALTPEQASSLGPVRAVDPKAHEAYLRGLYLFRGGLQSDNVDHDKIRASIPSFQEAIRLDPRFSEAWAAAARSYHFLAIGQADKSLYREAKAAALEALRLDDTLADGHGALAYTLWRSEWDWAGAEREFERARALDPNSYAWGHAQLLSGCGRHAEAVQRIRVAEERDPLNLTLKMHVVLLLTGARLYDDALAQLRLVLDIAPQLRPRVQTRKGVVLVLMGRCAEGLAALREGVDDAETGWGAALCGERAEAERMMARIREAREHASEMDLAGILAALGRHDEAMAQLEESYRLRQEPLLFALEWPFFDALRSDPRFRDLERRVGIPRTGTP